MRLLQVVGDDLQRAKVVGLSAVRATHVTPPRVCLTHGRVSHGPVSRGSLGEVGEIDGLDLVDRELEEAGAGGAKVRGVAGRQETVGALTGPVVLDPLAGEGLGDLAGGLLRREDERDAAAEDSLEDRRISG